MRISRSIVSVKTKPIRQTKCRTSFVSRVHSSTEPFRACRGRLAEVCTWFAEYGRYKEKQSMKKSQLNRRISPGCNCQFIDKFLSIVAPLRWSFFNEVFERFVIRQPSQHGFSLCRIRHIFENLFSRRWNNQFSRFKKH